MLQSLIRKQASNVYEMVFADIVLTFAVSSDKECIASFSAIVSSADIFSVKIYVLLVAAIVRE